jgi:excisionase family DNA binding protein
MAIRRGQVPAHRLGRRMRFSVQELDAHLMGRRAVVVEE